MASFFDAEFEGPLDDIMYEGHKLCYTVNGRTQTVECLAVITSGVVVEGDAENALEPGDLFVSVNGEPLINLVYQRGHVEFMHVVNRILYEQSLNGSRVIRFLRPHVPSVTTNAEGIDILSNITLLTLRQEEASLIFDEVKQREYVEKKMTREYERQQAKEQRTLERKAQEEIKLLKAEGYIRELRREVSKLRELEKSLHEMQMVVDVERKRVASLEANFYGDYIATSSLHEVKYPDYQQALGLTIVPMKMTFVPEEKEEDTMVLDICVVTNSLQSADVRIGDFVVQINGIPLVSHQYPLSKSDDDVRLYHERVLDTIAISRRPRTLLVLRPSGPAADAFKLTMSLTMYCVYITADQEKAIFSNPLLHGGAAAADARIIQPSPFLYGVQGMGSVNALPSSSMISTTGIVGGIGGLSHNIHNLNQHHQQQHHNQSLSIQNSMAPNGGARGSLPQGYPPHLMNTPTSSFPSSPQFSTPHMLPLAGGGGGMSFPIGYSNGYVDAHIPRSTAPSMTIVQSISPSTHHTQSSPLSTTMNNGIIGGGPLGVAGIGTGSSLSLGSTNVINPSGITLSSSPHMNIYPQNSPLPPGPLPVSLMLPPSSTASLLPHAHPSLSTNTPSLTTTFNGLTLRSSEEEEISRQVDAEIRRFKAEEEMKRMQEIRRKAEEEEMVRKIEEQALKEINEEKKRLAALLTNPSTL